MEEQGLAAMERDVMYGSFWRGWMVFLNENEVWEYEDGTEVDKDPNRVCPRCHRPPTPEGYDACLGHIPGCTSACCGHGQHEPIFIFG